MKKIFLGLTMLSLMSLSAYAQDSNEFLQEQPLSGIIEPLSLRSCDSSNLGGRESCISQTDQCPGGYDGRANYCCDSNSLFHRCGTVCQPHHGGR